MKSNILSFIMGLLVFALLAATPMSDLMTFKPATPRLTVSYCGTNPVDFTSTWVKKGYQVRATASQGYYNTYVVMVKY